MYDVPPFPIKLNWVRKAIFIVYRNYFLFI